MRSKVRVGSLPSMIMIASIMSMAANAEARPNRPGTGTKTNRAKVEKVERVEPKPAPEAAPPTPAATTAQDAIAPPPVPATAQVDEPHRILHTLAEQSRKSDLAEGYVAVATGAAAVAGGLIADYGFDDNFGKFVWIPGAAAVTFGTYKIIRGQAKSDFDELDQGATSKSPEDLRAAWAHLADESAKKRRRLFWSAVVGSSIFIGLGVAYAAGVFDVGNDIRAYWSTFLIGVGGATLGKGIYERLVESPVESGYRLAYGTSAAPRVSFGATPLRGGGAAVIRGSF